MRFEQLHGQYRVGREGSDQGLFLRTNVRARARFSSVLLETEVLDARHVLGIADGGSPLSASTINPLDVLQANLQFNTGQFAKFGPGVLKLGRFTMDLGSGRFVTRNGTRNTINSYAGLEWSWGGAQGSQWRAFYTSPVQRRVDGLALDNRAKTDQVQAKARFWGLHNSSQTGALKTQWFWFGLKEQDAVNQPSANRNIDTLGVSLATTPGPGRWMAEVETAAQWGEVWRGSQGRQKHSAYFFHLTGGYQIDSTRNTLWALHYDYVTGDVTGDDNPADQRSQGFDSLFGGRRGDFGPTGIFGPFTRTNLNTPGLSLTTSPSPRWQLKAMARGYWLASQSGGLPAAGITSNQASSRYIGSQASLRLRWRPSAPWLLDATAAYLAAGDVLEHVGKGDARYAYLALTYQF
ncbi:hypothetical protein GCM10025791_33900 [Halioxenophilus aromaticivorans]|uniref:Alginate export domain-containing protein n=1 Tax=Halioxenophilus aromaticivorans TaxID=1306992 RepID=A0AAV3U642_9ALTE